MHVVSPLSWLAALAVVVVVCFAPTAHGAACDCVSDPTQSCCADWVYPDANATADANNNCHMMYWMFGCGVQALCNQTTVKGAACSPFSILGDLCTDMGGMSPCATYNAVCKVQGTRVPQCTRSAPLGAVLTTAQARDDVGSICSLMPGMDGCDKCVVVGTSDACKCSQLKDTTSQCQVAPTTSYLALLSGLCTAMPGMGGCARFLKMCSESKASEDDSLRGVCPAVSPPPDPGSSPLCNGQGTAMFMEGFESSLRADGPCVAFLFKEWVLDTRAKLGVGVAGAFVLAVCNGLLIRILGKATALRKRNKRDDTVGAVLKATLQFLACVALMANGYAVMLLAMSFYAWLFVAVVVGLALGHVVFGLEDAPASCHATRSNLDEGMLSPYEKLDA